MSRGSRRNRKKRKREPGVSTAPNRTPQDPTTLDKLPSTYQEVADYYTGCTQADTYPLRKETLTRLEASTGKPVIAYVMKVQHDGTRSPNYIDDSDMQGIDDLITKVTGKSVDVLIMSNGGSAEASERIVRMLRGRFEEVRFIVPSNAYSAATLICFSGDEVLMAASGTLGPIDPQVDGIPARAIIRAFERIEQRLKDEGPRALAAYMPLISKYDLHTLEICRSAEELSKELAEEWLAKYMLKCDETDERVKKIVGFCSDYDERKSHARSIDRDKARDLGINARDVEDVEGLPELTRSLANQYQLFFDRSPFYKLFEDVRGTHWGRLVATETVQIAPTPTVPGQ